METAVQMKLSTQVAVIIRALMAEMLMAVAGGDANGGNSCNSRCGANSQLK